MKFFMSLMKCLLCAEAVLGPDTQPQRRHPRLPAKGDRRRAAVIRVWTVN